MREYEFEYDYYIAQVRPFDCKRDSERNTKFWNGEYFVDINRMAEAILFYSKEAAEYYIDKYRILGCDVIKYARAVYAEKTP